jgi:hypothetical protein
MYKITSNSTENNMSIFQKTYPLTPFKKIIAAWPVNYKKRVETLWVKCKVFNIKEGDTVTLCY